MKVPPEVHGVFGPCTLAAFAGFALLGLFTAVAPAFLAETLGERNLAAAGAVVFCVFCASTCGQVLMGQIDARKALLRGCVVLVLGLLIIGMSLLWKSLALLIVGGVTGGIGQGMALRAALPQVGSATPDRYPGGATLSTFFVVAYVGISLPVVAVGALALGLGLRDAGLLFTGFVVLLVAGVAVRVGQTLDRSGNQS
ncbi:hypothetical protein [Streptomyces sp. NPDC048663]|uniref:hypothetical protein n=1 Tax=Streptomyces sp. NPDC048663 TaxID=3155638 RepID=UPI00341C8104